MNRDALLGEREPVDRDELGDGAPDEGRERGVGCEELPVGADDEAADGRTLERRQEASLRRPLRHRLFEELGDVVEDRRRTFDGAVVAVDRVGVDAQPGERVVGAADPHRLVTHRLAGVQGELSRLCLERPG